MIITSALAVMLCTPSFSISEYERKATGISAVINMERTLYHDSISYSRATSGLIAGEIKAIAEMVITSQKPIDPEISAALAQGLGNFYECEFPE